MAHHGDCHDPPGKCNIVHPLRANFARGGQTGHLASTGGAVDAYVRCGGDDDFVIRAEICRHARRGWTNCWQQRDEEPERTVPYCQGSYATCGHWGPARTLFHASMSAPRQPASWCRLVGRQRTYTTYCRDAPKFSEATPLSSSLLHTHYVILREKGKRNPMSNRMAP